MLHVAGPNSVRTEAEPSHYLDPKRATHLCVCGRLTGGLRYRCRKSFPARNGPTAHDVKRQGMTRARPQSNLARTRQSALPPLSPSDRSITPTPLHDYTQGREGGRPSRSEHCPTSCEAARQLAQKSLNFPLKHIVAVSRHAIFWQPVRAD